MAPETETAAKVTVVFSNNIKFPGVKRRGGGASVPSLHPHPSARTTPPKRTIFWVRLPLVQPLFALFATRGKSQIHSSLLPGLNNNPVLKVT